MVATLVAIALLLMLNAVFAAAEFGAISARKSRIRTRAESGSRLAQLFLPVVEDPKTLDRYITACQLGITISSLSLGAVAEAELAERMRPWFAGAAHEGTVAHTLSTVLTLVVITALQVVLAEQVPKSVALRFPNRTAIYTVLPVRWTLRLLGPLLRILEGSAAALLRALRAPSLREHHLHNSEEIDLLIADSRHGGLLDRVEQQRLSRALNLGSRTVQQIMVPRSRIFAVDGTLPVERIVASLLEAKHTRVPIYKGSLDDVLGIVHLKDLLAQQLLGGDFDLRACLHKALSVPQTLPADRLIVQLREHRAQLALVVDDKGRLVGLVSLEDVLAEVFGQQEHESETLAERLPNGRVRIAGTMRLAEAAPWIGIRWRGRANTVGGHVIDMLGHFATPGETVTIDGVEVVVERITKNRMVASVVVTPLSRPETD